MPSYHSISYITFINKNEGKHLHSTVLNPLVLLYHHHSYYEDEETERDYLKLKQQSHVLNLGSLTVTY